MIIYIFIYIYIYIYIYIMYIIFTIVFIIILLYYYYYYYHYTLRFFSDRGPTLRTFSGGYPQPGTRRPEGGLIPPPRGSGGREPPSMIIYIFIYIYIYIYIYIMYIIFCI